MRTQISPKTSVAIVWCANVKALHRDRVLTGWLAYQAYPVQNSGAKVCFGDRTPVPRQARKGPVSARLARCLAPRRRSLDYQRVLIEIDRIVARRRYITVRPAQHRPRPRPEEMFAAHRTIANSSCSILSRNKTVCAATCSEVGDTCSPFSHSARGAQRRGRDQHFYFFVHRCPRPRSGGA